MLRSEETLDDTFDRQLFKTPLRTTFSLVHASFHLCLSKLEESMILAEAEKGRSGMVCRGILGGGCFSFTGRHLTRASDDVFHVFSG